MFFICLLFGGYESGSRSRGNKRPVAATGEVIDSRRLR